MNISADDKPVSKRRIIMVYNFTVSEMFVKQNIKKAFNPCFNPSEFIIQSVVSPLIF